MSEETGTSVPACEITLLLPWYVTGQLPPDENRHIEASLSRDASLTGHLGGIRLEKAAISAIHDDLGEPSPRTLLRLIASIAAESGTAPETSPSRGRD